MIDTSKIRPGDTGTIKVRFRELGKGGMFWWVDADMPEKFGPQYLPIAPSSISSHTPAPWVPEKRDVVAWRLSRGEWTIRAIDGDEAWVESEIGNDIVRLHSLTLIRKGVA